MCTGVIHALQRVHIFSLVEVGTVLLTLKGYHMVSNVANILLQISTKIIGNRCQIKEIKFTKFNFDRGFTRTPLGLQLSPTSLAGFWSRCMAGEGTRKKPMQMSSPVTNNICYCITTEFILNQLEHITHHTPIQDLNQNNAQR